MSVAPSLAFTCGALPLDGVSSAATGGKLFWPSTLLDMTVLPVPVSLDLNPSCSTPPMSSLNKSTPPVPELDPLRSMAHGATASNTRGSSASSCNWRLGLFSFLFRFFRRLMTHFPDVNLRNPTRKRGNALRSSLTLRVSMWSRCFVVLLNSG